MRIAIVTETWLPSINGVVTRLVATVRELLARDHMVMLVCPTVAEPPGGVANPPGAAVCHVPSVGLPFIYGGQPWGLPLPRVMRLLDGFRPTWSTLYARFCWAGPVSCMPVAAGCRWSARTTRTSRATRISTGWALPSGRCGLWCAGRTSRRT